MLPARYSRAHNAFLALESIYPCHQGGPVPVHLANDYKRSGKLRLEGGSRWKDAAARCMSVASAGQWVSGVCALKV